MNKKEIEKQLQELQKEEMQILASIPRLQEIDQLRKKLKSQLRKAAPATKHDPNALLNMGMAIIDARMKMKSK